MPVGRVRGPVEKVGKRMLAAVLGWVGTIGTIGAFALHSTGRMSSLSVRYALLNVVGGLLASAGAGLYGAWPNAASNLIWAGLGLRALVVALRERRGARVVLEAHADEDPQPVVLAA